MVGTVEPEEVEGLYSTYQFDLSPQAASGDASPVSLQWFLVGFGDFGF